MDDDIYQKLLGFALNYVSIRPRSEKEIRQYLFKKIHRWKLSETLGEEIINRLRELGYVDDLKFALAFIGSRNKFRPKGKMLLKMELQKKGVSWNYIAKALEQSVSSLGDSEADLARKAATKKLRSLKRYDKREKRDKLYSFLIRRGFDHDTIRSLIDEILLKGL